jgi:general secretion pathway protein K
MPREIGIGQHGVALVVVLWVVFLLTAIASSFVYNARTHVQLADNLLARTRAQALADAGVQRAVYELLKPTGAGDRWRPEGQVQHFELGDGKVTVRIVEESAFIDLNTAPEPLLMGLFKSVGVEEGGAQALVDAIQDWKDVDDLTRASGAERDRYLAAGLKQVPPNAEFRRVDELKSVLGMTPALYDKIASALTVYSRASGINSALAPREVLLAIPDVTAEQVDAYLVARQEELSSGLTPAPFAPAAAFPAAGTGMIYTCRSEAVLSDGTVFVREAVAGLTRDPQHPFGFLDWREGRPHQQSGKT